MIRSQEVIISQPTAATDRRRWERFQLPGINQSAITKGGHFLGNGTFIKKPTPVYKDLGDTFCLKVFTLLKNEEQIKEFIIDNIMN